MEQGQLGAHEKVAVHIHIHQGNLSNARSEYTALGGDRVQEEKDNWV